MNKLTAIRIKYDDGTYSDEIPVSTLAEYIFWDDSHNLVDILGNIDMSKGTVQAQLNDKLDNEELADYVQEQISSDVTSWLNTHVTPAGSAVVVDNTLSVTGAAADAKAAGDAISELNDRCDDLKSAFDLVADNLVCTETQTDKQNTNYCLIDTLIYGKTYRIGVSVATSGNYGVKVATDGSASYVVSTLMPDNTPFNANEKKYVLYTPVGNGEKYIRLSSKTVSWSVYVSEVIDVSDVSAQVDENKDNIEMLEGNVSYVAETMDTFTKTETDKQLLDYHNAEIYRGIFDGSNNTFVNTVARNAMVMVAEVNAASEKNSQ